MHFTSMAVLVASLALAQAGPEGLSDRRLPRRQYGNGTAWTDWPETASTSLTVDGASGSSINTPTSAVAGGMTKPSSSEPPTTNGHVVGDVTTSSGPEASPTTYDSLTWSDWTSSTGSGETPVN